jgi:hypothetical protein
MISEVIEAKRFHCGQMIRRLRQDHAAVLAGAKIDAHRNLADIFDCSTWRRAWFLDGKLMAIAGVEGPLCSASGEIWLAVAEAALKHRLLTAKVIRDQLGNLSRYKRTLIATVLSDDPVSVRMARRLGFSVKDETSIAGKHVFIMSYSAGQR